MELLQSLLNLVVALVDVLATAVRALWPWTPLILWIAFWTFAVDWRRLYDVLRLKNGGIVGLLLIGLIAVLVWGCVAPPAGGYHYLLGLKLTNFVGKFVYVGGLLAIMFLCGSVQLSGCCDRYVQFDVPVPEPVHAAHGSADHGAGGHDDGHAHAPAEHGHGHH